MGSDSTYRAAAIGRTNAGGYGHGLHLPYAQLDNVQVVAIADRDEDGRKAAVEEAGAARGYADFRDLLRQEEPDIVSVCPRWTDCHLEMVLACIEAGAHVYCEKPMTWDLEEGDQIVAAAAAAGRKVAVAHQTVYLPVLRGIKRLVEEGRIGQLRSVHGRGKQDARGGGEDMIVLGTHLFNAMRFLAGDVAWMSAHVTADGRELSLADVREAGEPVGPVAGDCIHSYFAFASGVDGTFASRRHGAQSGSSFGIELVGGEGRVSVRCSGESPMIYPHPDLDPAALDQQWQPLDELEVSSLHGNGNRLAILDLIGAIEEDRQPLSSAADAVAALEMILGTYQAQITGGRVKMPMKSRRHPLVAWQEGYYRA